MVDGVEIDVDPGLYELGLPMLAADHDKAKCENLAGWPGIRKKNFVKL